MSTRKVGKFNKNSRKSNKKYIKKRRKYTQKGKGLGDELKNVYRKASRSASKFTRGPLNRESMRELQQELETRKRNSVQLNNDCPLCLDPTIEAKVPPITGTPEELERLKTESGTCQPCNQCAHPFHLKCVEEYYDSKNKKSSVCPMCRDESFKEFQNKNYVTKRLERNNAELGNLQAELREMGNQKGPPPPRYNEIQTRLKELELDIQCDTDYLNPNISEDEYIKRWRKRR
jgi:hypothetical protein